MVGEVGCYGWGAVHPVIMGHQWQDVVDSVTQRWQSNHPTGNPMIEVAAKAVARHLGT
jgi:hypothetical protein